MSEHDEWQRLIETKKIAEYWIERCSRAEKQLEQRNWVSVKDRLPEKHGWYLVAHKRTYPTDSGMKVCFFCHGRFVAGKIEVTSWRPLPEYPESE